MSIHCFKLPCDVTTTQLCRIPLKMQVRHDGPAQCPQNCPSYAIGVVVVQDECRSLIKIYCASASSCSERSRPSRSMQIRVLRSDNKLASATSGGPASCLCRPTRRLNPWSRPGRGLLLQTPGPQFAAQPHSCLVLDGRGARRRYQLPRGRPMSRGLPERLRAGRGQSGDAEASFASQ